MFSCCKICKIQFVYRSPENAGKRNVGKENAGKVQVMENAEKGKCRETKTQGKENATK